MLLDNLFKNQLSDNPAQAFTKAHNTVDVSHRVPLTYWPRLF